VDRPQDRIWLRGALIALISEASCALQCLQDEELGARQQAPRRDERVSRNGAGQEADGLTYERRLR
jgi:hypothetical protein